MKLVVLLLLMSCGKDVPIKYTKNQIDRRVCYQSNSTTITCNGVDYDLDIPTYMETEMVVVCEDVIRQNPEVLIKIGNVFYSFLSNPNWNQQRLIKLESNVVYKTSDGANINFNVNNGTITCL